MNRITRRDFLKSAGAAAVAGSVIGPAGVVPHLGGWEQAAGNAARLNEWRAQRFGMFIHWGPVSLRGTEIGWSRGAQVPIEEYDNLYRRFDPTRFDAGALVKLARESGMKYLVFTTKHHDGFCMWDTRQTDYNIMHSPFGRDVVNELAAACRQQGVAFGAYHSVCDWHHPDFPRTSPGGSVRRAVSNLDRYEQYLRAQVKELIIGYGPLQVMWFDVPQEFEEQRGLALEQWTRSLQPDIIINDRSGARGDYDTPEQRVGKYQDDRPWETCMTLCQQWAWKPDDDMKSLKDCIQALVLCAGGDGNLLFNVGPMPDGRVEPRQAERLREMGAWLATNGESIYGTRGGPWKPTRAVASTRRGNVVFVHVLRWDGDSVTLPDIPLRVVAARLPGGERVDVRQANGELVLRVPPAARHEIDTLVRLELAGSAMNLKAVELPRLVAATASNVFRNRASEYGPEMAFDNDPATRWATDTGTKQAWIAAEFPRPLSIQRVRIEEALAQRVQQFEFQYLDGAEWRTIFAGSTLGRWFQKTFAPVRGQAFRLNILDATEGPTITDIELFEK